ncbi:MAG: DNA polymerase IV [Natronospirillum sp.]|uniref:DNA polymerase IV n=1 Tax=Natronospirillum sp. TaxID=2812955 RepID=UPI0025D06AC4|nr:DNA polymerase IV [Natronospirillum sp.]MCH8553332.1 DNA polymerase IV [Natronospirillum sp.]
MRKILHSDADCFYAAVEMRDFPQYRGIPLAVGGSADGRGVIATCNYEARAYGIHSAMSSARALRLCPHLTLVRGRMDVYKAVSREIFTIYRRYTDLIEPLSLDEAFMDVSHSNACQGSATRMAEAIRAQVQAEVGLTVSIGVAPNKFLAKIASDWNKPDGMKVILPQDIETFVRDLPVSKLHGVGKRTAEKLHAQSLFTCGDIRQLSLHTMLERFGSFGQRLHELAHGRDERPVKVSRERKSISTEQTYSEDLPDLEACQSRLPELIDDLTQRYARLQGYRIQGALVKVKFADFTQTTIEHSHPAPEPALFDQLLQEGWARRAMPVRLLGVGYRLQRPGEGEPTQLKLFE